MPHPEREHELMIEVARLRRENERLDRTLASAFEDLHAEQRRAETAQEALAAARRECEGLRAIAEATLMFHGARVWDDEASEKWHRLTGQPSTTKGLCDFARKALAVPADGEETYRCPHGRGMNQSCRFCSVTGEPE